MLAWLCQAPRTGCIPNTQLRKCIPTYSNYIFRFRRSPRWVAKIGVAKIANRSASDESVRARARRPGCLVYARTVPDHEPPPFSEVTARTLGNYDAQAQSFWVGTRDHDVTQNYAALLDALERSAPLRLLDLGCGPGRDLIALSALGHAVTGLDGSAVFAEMARAQSGCLVLQQNFLELTLGERRFDGVFANASLFHVPRAELPRVLAELFCALVPGGVLFCSNPRSFERDWEGFKGERYGSFLTVETWLEQIKAAGFVVERHFLRPTGKPPSEQPWLAIVARRPVVIGERAGE